MNDDFLKAHRHPPDPAFAARLRRKLQTSQPVRPPQAACFARKAGYALAGLTLTLAILFWAAPDVRARAVSFVRQMGGLSVSQSSELPLAITPPSPLTMETLPLGEASARFGGPVRLPTWLPEGFIQEPQAEYAGPPESVQALLFTHWRAGERRVTLMMRHLPPGTSAGLDTLLKDGSAVQVLIGGQSGVLALGTWNAESAQFEPGSLAQLHWQVGADTRTIYTLIARRGDASADELIRMASSIP